MVPTRMTLAGSATLLWPSPSVSPSVVGVTSSGATGSAAFGLPVGTSDMIGLSAERAGPWTLGLRRQQRHPHLG